MINKIFLIFILIIYPFNTYAIQIITNITPIASLVKMLTKDKAIVTSILTKNICPHHYNLTPADFNKVKNADIAIYIDKEFDGFAYKLMNKNNNVIRISSFSDINFIKFKNNINWHFWLDLKNVDILLKHLAKIIITHYPDIENDIEENLKLALQKIAKLSNIKKSKLHNLGNIIIATDSLEYFFLNSKANVNLISQYDHSSLKYFNLLNKIDKSNEYQCIVLSQDQNTKLYKKFTTPYIQISSENWELEGDLEDLYYKKYLEIINHIAYKCSK